MNPRAGCACDLPCFDSTHQQRIGNQGAVATPGDGSAHMIATLSCSASLYIPLNTAELLDGHGLCQVARLIDITAAAYSDVIGKQLQWHNFKDW